MAPFSNSVTLDRAYFETLLRKAQFHSSGTDHSTPVDLPMVTIPKSDYDGLVRYTLAPFYATVIFTEYSLLLLGNTILVSNDTLANAQESTINLGAGGTVDADSPLTRVQESPTAYRVGPRYNNENANKYANYGSNHMMGHAPKAVECSGQFDDNYSPNEGQGGYFNNGNSRVEVGRDGQFLRNTKRTIQLSNLPEATTHGDVTDAVKGGMLLDIFLRTQDRAASISFLDGNAANDFFRYAKRNDLYIRGKRVAISWSDRHFTLANHVAHKIGMGATRNIVIRSASTRHTDESIREDLDHIHNLVVVNIKFVDRDAHVSTNSVHNAMFARTCMMSRSKYKGSKIEWDIDECAAPIPVLKPRPVQKENNLPKVKAPINRFALLNMDGATDSSADEDSMLGMDSFQSDLVSGLNGVAVKLPLVLGWASRSKDDDTFFYGHPELALLMFTAADTQQFAFAFAFHSINILLI
ncbi:hypothetical protein V491_03472 [Pseudogymnoascus sp. VKM F-3775]|nr:hypothetical protein V491_03472 [Pseudogymnoascus sp. VKM F-3775]